MIWKLVLAALTGLIWVSAATAEDAPQSCSMDGPKLICAKSLRDQTTILEAMANSETLALIESLGTTKAFAQSAQDREIFRKSLEKNHRAIRLFAKAQFRKYRKRRISAEAYEAVRAKYETGLLAYKAGLDAYRKNRWFDPKPAKEKSD